jgi:LysM repeat protein
VKKGDVLEKIARQHNTSVDAIIAYNQLGSTNLRIGQVLKIPSKKTAQAQTPAPTAQPKADGHKYYTVKTGDNPWTIAVKNHMKVEELLRINQLDQEKARKLKPGDKLLIQ